MAHSLLLDRGYTSHEHLFEVGLIHMNGRLYDPLLRRFLNADEHIQDPYNTQNYNKYGYVYNNPLMYNDPSGEFAFLVPILTKVLIGAIYGAIVGAGVGAIAYTIKGLVTKEWSWSNFGKAILGGAIAGAISGGLNGLGASIFSTNSFILNSGTWDLLSNMISSVIQDGKIDFATIGASAIGAFVSQKLPKWKGLDGKGIGGWLKNAGGELLHGTLKGGITGAISGGFNSLFRGGNIWDGVKAGFKNGMYNGAAQSAFMIGTFGATYKPSEKQLEYVKKMSKKYNVDYSNVKWRTGGFYNLLIPDAAVVWGNNVVTTSKQDASRLLGHEFGHIIQVSRQGWANFQARGIWEQLYVSGILGIDPYNTYRVNKQQYNEYDAEEKVKSVIK